MHLKTRQDAHTYIHTSTVEKNPSPLQLHQRTEEPSQLIQRGLLLGVCRNYQQRASQVLDTLHEFGTSAAHFTVVLHCKQTQQPQRQKGNAFVTVEKGKGCFNESGIPSRGVTSLMVRTASRNKVSAWPNNLFWSVTRPAIVYSRKRISALVMEGMVMCR